MITSHKSHGRELCEARTITVFVVAYADERGEIHADTFADETTAGVELDLIRFNRGHPNATLTACEIDLQECFKDGWFYTAVSKDGKKAEGIFPKEIDAQNHCDTEYPPPPGLPSRRKPEYSPLAIEIV